MVVKNLMAFSILILIISISSISSETFGIDTPTLPKLIQDIFGGQTPDYYMPNNLSVFGNFSFNDDCLDGGIELRDDGTICGQALEVFNITSVNVTKQNVTVLENFIVEGDVITSNLIPEVNNTGSVGLFNSRWAQGFFSVLNVSNLGGLSPINVGSNLIGAGFNFTADNFFGNFNASFLENPPWVERAGDNMTGNLTIIDANLTVDNYVGIGTRNPTSQLTIIGSLNQSQGNMTGNLIYGEMFNRDDSGVTITLNTVDVFENVTGLNVGDSNGVSFNNNALIPSISGNYIIQYSASVTGSANSQYLLAISVNDVIQNETAAGRTISAGGSIVSVGSAGIITLNVGDRVNLQVADVSPPAQDITYLSVSINMVRVGE